MNSIEKMRAIINWANYQDEYFNERFKSISDIEKAYDYCVKNGWEFLDRLDYVEQEDYNKIVKDVTDLLGYSIF